MRPGLLDEPHKRRIRALRRRPASRRDRDDADPGWQRPERQPTAPPKPGRTQASSPEHRGRLPRTHRYSPTPAVRQTGDAARAQLRLTLDHAGVSDTFGRRVRREPPTSVRPADLVGARVLPPAIERPRRPARADRRARGRERSNRARVRQPPISRPPRSTAPRTPRRRPRRRRRWPQTCTRRTRTVRALTAAICPAIRRSQLVAAPIVPLTAAFFGGRLVSYSIYVTAASSAKYSLGSIIKNSFTSSAGIALQVAMIAGLIALIRVDWAKLLTRNDTHPGPDGKNNGPMTRANPSTTSSQPTQTPKTMTPTPAGHERTRT